MSKFVLGFVSLDVRMKNVQMQGVVMVMYNIGGQIPGA